MNDNTALAPLTEAEQKRIHTPEELWTDNFALKVTMQDFAQAEAYRTQNCDWRWRRANQLYEAHVDQKYWTGTKQPRASMGVFLCFEQVESIMPKVMQALFGDNPFFDAFPLGKTTAKQAREWEYLLLAQMEHEHIREKVRRVVKSMLMYGNGILKVGWCQKEVRHQQWLSKLRPRKDPFTGQMSFDRVLDKKTTTRIENYPEIDHVQVEDFYMDPNCPSPVCGDARYVIERQLVTVDYLDSLRDDGKDKAFDIPSKMDLIQLATLKTTRQGDQTKQSGETFRMGNWQPWVDYTVDPGAQRIEVLSYTTKERVVWVAGGEYPIYNAPNSYGFINYYNAYYADVLGRFWALGICDVIGGEQQFQQSLRNARLDELSLALHRPLIRKIGLKVPEYQRVVKPGQQWEAENPRDDFVFLDIPNITQNAYIEDQYSGMRAQKTTGVTDLATLGVPSAGGNAAARTATGVNTQASASASRQQYLVENIENSMLEPFMNDLVSLNILFPPIGPMGETIATSRVELSMRASAKMASKASLMQTFPLIAQTLMSPGLLSDLASQGMTIDWQEIMLAIQDMTGWRGKADLIRKMTPEEQKARQSPGPENEMKMKMQQERIMGQAAIQKHKTEASMMESDKQREDGAESQHTDSLLKMALELIRQKDKEKKKEDSDD